MRKLLHPGRVKIYSQLLLLKFGTCFHIFVERVLAGLQMDTPAYYRCLKINIMVMQRTISESVDCPHTKIQDMLQ